jgi:hypothetical protein
MSCDKNEDDTAELPAAPVSPSHWHACHSNGPFAADHFE